MSTEPNLPTTESAAGSWPESRRRQGVRWLVLAQVGFVLAVALAGYATGALGRTITLRTAPVDARDLLYGDYVLLRYSISQLPGHFWHGAERPRRKQAAFVLLEPGPDGIYEAVGVYAEKPVAAPQQAVLRGSVQDVWRRSLRLRYGLERYYVPEELRPKLQRRQPLRVQVSIVPWGQARIKEVSGF